MRMPSPNRNTHFDGKPSVDVARSQLNRSYAYKTTFDAGWLVPILVDEVLPGDSVNLRISAFMRMATPLKPLMDNLVASFFFFFVPHRLVWDNFKKMMGEQANPGDSVDYLVPQITNLNFPPQSLPDYFGLPLVATGTPPSVTYLQIPDVSALPFRADALVWNDWFRDQKLQNSVVIPKGDGPDDYNNGAVYKLRKRGKRGDYFTTAFPAPQQGSAVRIPLANVQTPSASGSSYANIVGSSAGPTFKNAAASATLKKLQFGATAASGAVNFGSGSGSPTSGQDMIWHNPDLWMYDGQMGTINQLRTAVQIQRLLEREARGGTRYVEWLRNVFGVDPGDYRLQRPEYLGGGRVPVVITPLAQSSANENEPTPLGNLGGVGTAAGQGIGFAKSFVEHGTLLGYVSVQADLTYQQSLDRMWTRRTKLDHAMPVTAHLGEQAVLRKEIYCLDYTSSASNDTVFGYQERFAEYRFKNSLVTGKFRSQYFPGTGNPSLDVWHLAQQFASAPVLGATFIEDDPPVDRVIAVQDEPHFLYDSWVRGIWARALPAYGEPGMMDHF